MHLISVQKGAGEEELISTKTNITSFENFDNDTPFRDTIAILHNVDLLITIDTGSTFSRSLRYSNLDGLRRYL